jgi:hypothetical protein
LQRHDPHPTSATGGSLVRLGRTDRTPSNNGPFAAQSRLDPLPYSLPAITASGTPSSRYRSAASKTDVTSPSGRWVVHDPSVPGASSLRNRMFAKVPRIIT